ncbi:ACP S-malonyltransferase [Ahrensia sp. R2A130]|uniref:ACP S-malonyltransferase n=1 Tax=Ahrensia sp. R2A130 TaxID=744979 RepID=UPI0001E09C0D|nr:ACP S-malonyltransferase [Ahrensia sp. R2A130]EFL90604.1 malonyl CoA-acyl carrier protein transacylase [Ahrensia sp. R2A130]
MLALTFPGQGSQAVGMGRAIADAYPEAKAVFDEVDDALGEKLSAVIFDGPDDALTLTTNAQPALMAVSLAVLRAMESEGFMVTRADYVAGHSLGEYSALAAARAITIGDTARLLRIRGEAMQAAVPVGKGAMAAIIGLEQDAVETACTNASQPDDEVQIANDNGGGQLVISGHAGAVERAMEACKEAGAKRALPLPVSAPFHSTLMAPAADRMKDALAAVDIKPTIVPLVCNVLADPISHPEDIRKNLVEQVTGRVRWAESVEYMAEQGVNRIWEVGSGKVLTGLARRIDRTLEGTAIGAPDDISAALAQLG